MNTFIATSLSLPALHRTIPDWKSLSHAGHNVTLLFPGLDPPQYEPDVLIMMGISAMPQTKLVLTNWPGTTFFCYHWDCYGWVWVNPRPGEYDYKAYGELLGKAAEIWVPSECTRVRTKQWWNLESKVILSSVPYWSYKEVKNGGYILCTLRELPDPHWDWFESACQELELPYLMTQHNSSFEGYQKAVANCSFLVSHLYEASTGGLSLLEGYYLGKPCLLSNSPWHGGVDYLGDRADYFQWDSYDDLKWKLSDMWNNPRVVDPEQSRAWVAKHYSDKRMVKQIEERISCVIQHS